MPPVNTGHLIHELRQALQQGVTPTRLPRREARERLEQAAKQQAVMLCERLLNDQRTDPGTRTLAVALLVNLAESYGIET